MSKSARVIQVAERELGVTEQPPGSNRGARVETYQRATTLGGTGWPWCAAFVEWVWRQAGVQTDACSPSTQVMADRARALGWVGDPVPGAAIVWDGVHTEILISPAGGTVWHTIGGNTGDAVRRRVRDTNGTTIVRPPDLDGEAAPARQYLLEDVAAEPRLLGPWRTTAYRDRAVRQLPPRERARARLVTHRGKPAVLIGPRRLYGPWHTTTDRDRARAVLEQRLGRRLRPFSRPTPTTKAGSAEGLGKTT